MKYVAVYIGSNLEFNFFSRMAEGLRSFENELLILSNKLSVIIKAIRKQYRFKLIKENSSFKDFPDLSCCHDVLEGFTSLYKAEVLYSSIYNGFKETLEQYCIGYIFIWNGLSIQTIAVSNFAGDFKIKTRYFELSNLPDKLFVNPVGVNARSSLVTNIDILKNYHSDEIEYQKWKEYFIKYKKEQLLLPQSKQKRIQNYLYLFDLLGFNFFNLPANGQTNLVGKLKYLLKRSIDVDYDEYDYENSKYVFIPLQVNKDSQIIFNSDFSNYDLIKSGIKVSNELNTDLVIKIHPAESDTVFINQICELKKIHCFFIVNYSSINLVAFSQQVLTINSTVGMEGMILEKEVVFFGRSFYPLLSKQYLKNYILKYLIDTEYFSDSTINKKTIRHILDIE